MNVQGPFIISSNGCLSFPRRRHAGLTNKRESHHRRRITYRDAHDPLVVDQNLVISVPLLTRGLAIRQRGDDVVKKFLPLLDLARFRDHFQSVTVLAAPGEGTTYALGMEVANDDRVPGPYLDKQWEKRAARAAGPTRCEAVLPVSPAGHRRAPCVPRVFPIVPARSELAERAAPDPEGDRSKIIEVADDLPEVEGEAEYGRVRVADEWQAVGPRKEVA